MTASQRPRSVGRLCRRIGLPVLIGWMAAQVVTVGLLLWAVVLAGGFWLGLLPPTINALLLAHAILGDARNRWIITLGLTMATFASIAIAGFVFFWGAFALGGGLTGDPTPRGVLLGWILMVGEVALIAAAALTAVAVIRASRKADDGEPAPETATRQERVNGT